MEIVDADVTGSINIETTGCGIGTISKIYPETIILRTKKPYALNPSNLECVVGEWNKDKG